MTRLTATLRADVRLQLRNRLHHAAAVMAIASMLVLRWLPAEAAMLILPVLILENVLVNTFYFASGLLLWERDEGTFAAQSVTPLRHREYLGSKLITLTALSLGENLIIAASVVGLESRLLLAAVGIVLAAVLFCLAGIALVVRYASINEFLMPSVVYTLVLTLPILGVFGVGASLVYLPHPIHGTLALLQMPTSMPPEWWLYAIGYPMLWILPVYLWSRRALSRTWGR